MSHVKAESENESAPIHEPATAKEEPVKFTEMKMRHRQCKCYGKETV